MNKLEYDKDSIVKILKDINEFVVSLDQINKVYHEFGDSAWQEELIHFINERKLSQRLAHVRSVLSGPFSNELGDDDMDELEREMSDVNYWTFSEYLKKHKLKDK